MLKRIVDILISIIALIILLPFLILISAWIVADSKGPVFFRQVRVGRFGKDFRIYKFRTMYTGSDKKGLLTVGGRDSRISRAGYFLRKYKIDELPQLINVFVGDMSLTGPRPEVRKYVDLYNEEQLHVLDVRPGITDYASIEYSNENELLAKADDPEKEYVENILPAKLKLNLKYINNQGLATDLKIILKTLRKVIFSD